MITHPNNGDLVGKFRQHIEPLFKRLLVGAYRLTGSAEDAEDLVQETLLKAYKNMYRFDENSSPGGWVYTIMKNTFLNNLRDRKTKEVLLFNGDDVDRLADNTPDQTIPPEIEDDMQSIVNSLPDDMRVILIARETEGLTYQEIAQTLEIPIGTVKSRLKRARNVLQGKWLRHTVKVKTANEGTLLRR